MKSRCAQAPLTPPILFTRSNRKRCPRDYPPCTKNDSAINTGRKGFIRARTATNLIGSCLAKITDLRIVVSGSPGSGKTTFVKALAQKFELPILDEGWKNIQASQSVF